MLGAKKKLVTVKEKFPRQMKIARGKEKEKGHGKKK